MTTSRDEKIYNKYLDRLREKVIAKYDELGLRASGKFEKELTPEVKGNKLILWSAYHSIFMEKGRRAGGSPPIKAIYDWIEVKRGLPAEWKEKKLQMAFAIAKSIAKKGITVPNQFNKGEVIKSVVDDFLAKDIQEMLDELGIIFLKRMESDIVEILKAA